MAKSMAEERDVKSAQQEDLFQKIKGELFKSLADNFKRVEGELANIKTNKQTYEDQISQVMKTLSQPS